MFLACLTLHSTASHLQLLLVLCEAFSICYLHVYCVDVIFQLLEWPECLIDGGSNLDQKMTDVLERVRVGHIAASSLQIAQHKSSSFRAQRVLYE